MPSLSPLQQEIVDHIDGPLLVVSAPGTGKSRCLVYRIANLIKNYCNPQDILAITFTTRAAGELQSRLDSLGIEEITACTFHSLGYKVLTRDSNLIRLPNKFIILDNNRQNGILSRIRLQLGLSPQFYPLKLIKAYLQYVREYNLWKGDQTGLSSIKSWVVDIPQEIKIGCQQIFIEYMKYIRSQGMLDFDDLIYQSIRLLEKYPHVLDYWQNRFKYILVDEYQDVNGAQVKLLSLLANEHRNLHVVGDTGQSIYSFRLATPDYMERFKKDWPDVRIVKLVDNYRTTPTILEEAERILHSERDYGREAHSLRNHGENIIIKQLDNPESESKFVVEQALYWLQRNELPLSCGAILYRTHSLSMDIERECVHHKIPYRLLGGKTFSERIEIRNILSYLEALIRLNFDSGRLSWPGNRYDITSILNSMRNQKTIADKIEALLTQTYYRLRLNGDEEGEERIANIDTLINLSRNYEDIFPFLKEVYSLSSAPIEKDAINLCTVHGVKGAEFHHVAIVGVEDGLFPHINNPDKEEERRLLYVGMTRAKDRLILTYSKNRNGDTRTISPFIQKKEVIESGRVYHGVYGEGLVLNKEQFGSQIVLTIRFHNTIKNIINTHHLLRKI